MNSTGGPLVEGSLAIDLMNTEEIRRGIRRDFIGSAEDFSVWLKNEELAGAVSRVQIPFDVQVWSEKLERVHELRAEVRGHLERIADDEDISTEFVNKLESLVENAPYTMKMHDGKVVNVPIGDPIERLCSLVAADVLRMLGTGELRYLKRCENPNCLFMFLDTSGRRKWCSMKRCGNRMKVTKHMKQRSYSNQFR